MDYCAHIFTFTVLQTYPFMTFTMWLYSFIPVDRVSVLICREMNLTMKIAWNITALNTSKDYIVIKSDLCAPVICH